MSSLLDLVLSALGALHSPDASRRREAVNFLEQLKKGDVHALLQVAGSLMVHTTEEVLLAGFTLLTDLVKNRWAELSEEERKQVAEIAFKDVAEVCRAGKAAWAIKSKVAVLLSAVVRQQGNAAYAQLLPQLLGNADGKTLQAELACMVLHFISEDLTLFDTTQGEQKRAFLSALTASVNDVFPFLCRMLEQHFYAASECRATGNAEEFQAHMGVIAAALSALTTWVEWTPMVRIAASNVLDACTFFLDTPDFRLQALDVLKQIVSRKRTSERAEDYDALMDKAAALLLADCQKQGFLQPGGTLPPALAAQLDAEGALEEFGQRLCTVLVILGENHFKCMARGSERRTMYLQQMLALSRHGNVQLSALVLPLWAQLLREALPNVSGGTSLSPAIAAAAAARRSSDGHGPATSPTGAGPASHGLSIRPPSLEIPPELCQVLITVMCEQLPRVVLLAEDSSTDFPMQFDSHAEYKEFCSSYKGSVKQIIRAATHLVPEQGLAITADVLRAALAPLDPSPATNGNGTPQQLPKPQLLNHIRRLEAAVLALEAAVPAVTELATQSPAAADVLAALLNQLMAVRVPEPLTMTALLARVYEAFGRFLLQRPDLAAPLVSSCLRAMMYIPLDEAGHLPPPARLTSVWKRQAEGRLSMCAGVVTLAKAAPAAFVPYLEPLVTEVNKLWGQGLLREGERVLLWEGLLAASVAAAPAMQAQVVGYILGPVAAQWSDPGWRQTVASPLEFVSAYLPVQREEQGQQAPGQEPRWALGARAERWTLYHQATLMERAFRRTLTTGHGPSPSQQAAVAGAAADAASSSPPERGVMDAAATVNGAVSPICSHLNWSLPVVAQLMSTLHGLWEPSIAASLGPLQVIAGMDPLERAMRLGEDRDTIKEKEEPRCVAGASLTDARYFVRGVREACYMILSLAATYCGRALWGNAQLASSLVPALGSSLAHLDYQQLRMLHRHVFTAWAVHCPAELQPMWVLPICKAVLPSMSTRLAADWAASMSSEGGGRGAAQQAAAAQQQGPLAEQGSAASEEVVTDALLREATREHMALLLTLTRPPGAPDPASLPRAARGGAAAANGNGAATPVSRDRSPSGRSQQQQEGPSGTSGSGECVMDLLLRGDPAVAEAAMRTALMGLCWPDADAAAKAAGVCRYFVHLAMSLPSLEPFVCNDMLKTACCSLAQVFAVDIQSEVLGLIRAIMVTFMPRNAIVRRSMQQLLRVPDDVFDVFEKQLAVTGSDSKQRALIKQLVAQAGDEEVKKVLSSTLPRVPVSVVDPTPRPPKHVESEHDQMLGGQIFNMLFSHGS